MLTTQTGVSRWGRQHHREPNTFVTTRARGRTLLWCHFCTAIQDLNIMQDLITSAITQLPYHYIACLLMKYMSISQIACYILFFFKQGGWGRKSSESFQCLLPSSLLSSIATVRLCFLELRPHCSWWRKISLWRDEVSGCYMRTVVNNTDTSVYTRHIRRHTELWKILLPRYETIYHYMDKKMCFFLILKGCITIKWC